LGQDDDCAVWDWQDLHEEVVLRQAVCLYATYKFHNDIRHNIFQHQDVTGPYGRFIHDALH